MQNETDKRPETGLAWLIAIGSLAALTYLFVRAVGGWFVLLVVFGFLWCSAMIWALTRLLESFTDFRRRKSEVFLAEKRKTHVASSGGIKLPPPVLINETWGSDRRVE